MMIERRKNTFFSMETLEKVGLTAAFCFFLYLIWSSSAELENQLKANTNQFAVVHDLQIEYKSEVQEWKNILLRSDNQESLDKNWQSFESQFEKVAISAKQGMLQNDVRAINVKLQEFLEAHDANLLLYKKASEILVQQSFNPHQADTSVKGIDQPLLKLLEAADAEMDDEQMRTNGRLIAKSNSRIEQSLVALFLLMLIAIWRPRR
jgi:methyl-accepting chemotaxis protein